MTISIVRRGVGRFEPPVRTWLSQKKSRNCRFEPPVHPRTGSGCCRFARLGFADSPVCQFTGKPVRRFVGSPVLIAKPRFYFQNYKFYDFYVFINNFMISNTINDFLNKIGPIWARALWYFNYSITGMNFC